MSTETVEALQQLSTTLDNLDNLLINLNSLLRGRKRRSTDCSTYDVMVNIEAQLTTLQTKLTMDPIKSSATVDPLKTFVSDLLSFVESQIEFYDQQIATIQSACTTTTTSEPTTIEAGTTA